MTHRFDAISPESIRSPASIKWTLYAEDVLPLWVADMDFPVSAAILDRIKSRLDGWLGYGHFDGNPRLVELLIAQQAKMGWTGLEAKHFWPINGVVSGLYAGVLGLSSPGEDVITQLPIYPPFLSSIRDHGRNVIGNRLIEPTANSGVDASSGSAPGSASGAQVGWQIDFDQLETLVTPASRIFMLCNPQNPTGRVYSRPELERLAAFVLRHRLYVVSDELHADLILNGQPHIPFASLSPEIAQRTVTLTGPCKSFNAAGLSAGMAISQNTALLERMKQATKGLMGHPNVLALEMWLAGLEEGQAWLAEVIGYLRDNRDLLTRFLHEKLPEVCYVAPEGTYLAWMDFRAFEFANHAQKFMLEQAKVALNDGVAYGSEYQGFLRINLATSKPILLEALDRLERAVRSKAD
jgi:cysteine-S-conjugate beta-lyase